MLADTGERYLSTPLFDAVEAEMDAEEQAIAASTPSARFGVPGPAPAPAVATLAAPFADKEAVGRLVELIDGAPVVMFALEWCEFCWSLRKLLKAAGIPYKDVSLDSADLPGDLGLRLRRALTERTGVATIPQLFIGGRFVGGCTDTFDAYTDGSLRKALEAAGVRMQGPSDLDPASFLPRWLTQPKPQSAPRNAA
jgi:cysteine synthase A